MRDDVCICMRDPNFGCCKQEMRTRMGGQAGLEEAIAEGNVVIQRAAYVMHHVHLE